MQLSTVYSRASVGLDAPLVRVETHLANGLPAFNIVGLPEATVRESKDRVRSALLNSHFDFPDRRITVNLAPADLPKEGGRFDLPIALGILAASQQLPATQLGAHEFYGELALDGSLQSVRGIIPAVIATAAAKRAAVMAPGAAEAAARVPGSTVLAAADILTLCAHLNGAAPLSACVGTRGKPAPCHAPDLRQVRGQAAGRRALEIAASGRHNLLLFGPPGTGKTLLASQLPGILPPLEAADELVAMAVADLSGDAYSEDGHSPFRAPHHSASAAALIGGGSKPRPGEISRAHGGVLFLDELPEFSRHSLEALREPLESGFITLSRALYKIRYPARFQLVAAMNPCPCGHDGDPDKHCRCTPAQIERYRSRISGPLLDRIDLHIPMPGVPAQLLLQPDESGESSQCVRARTCKARKRQTARQGRPNSALSNDAVLAVCELTQAEKHWLEKAAGKLQLSARALHSVLRVARTIADLAATETVTRDHLGEALAFRNPLLQA
jgi:magnesium chelatase family protein